MSDRLGVSSKLAFNLKVKKARVVPGLLQLPRFGSLSRHDEVQVLEGCGKQPFPDACATLVRRGIGLRVRRPRERQHRPIGKHHYKQL